MPVFRRTKNWLAMIGVLFLSSLVFAACSERMPSTIDTAGPIADSERNVFWAIFAIATLVFVLVEGALIFSIIRYRARPGTPNPRQIHGSLKLEIAWTAIPSVFLVIILIFTIQGLIEVAPESKPSDSNELKVTAIGHQWWWEFYYEDYKFTTADSLVVPTGTIVDVKLYSNNVIHSFWVPQVAGKVDLVPGHENSRWFKVEKPGTYEGFCAEYCGTQHANMRFNLIAQDRDSFMSWVSEHQKPITAPAVSGEPVNGQHTPTDGYQVFEQNCKSCHGLTGITRQDFENTVQHCNVEAQDAAQCPLGPNLTHFASRDLIAGGVLENNIEACDPNDPNLYEKCNLAKWLQDPQGIKSGNAMVVELTDEQIRDLVAYLETLK